MRFLFCSLASPGWLFPSLAIAEALRRRGHTAAFVTGPAYGDLIRQAGFERIPRGAQDGPSFQVEHWGVALSIAIQVKHIEYALERFEADLLVGQQLTLGPLLVRERRRLPAAIIGLAAYLWPTSSAALTTADPSEREARQAWRFDDTLRIYNEARQLVRLPPVDGQPEEMPLLGDLFLLQSVPELAGDPAALPERVRLVGACLWEPPGEADAGLATWLDDARRRRQPVLYAQHGRTFHLPRFWPALLDAVRDRPVRVAAAVGRMDGAAGPTPANVLARDHIPQSPVLRAARGVISGGNTTVTLGALTHGLPSLLLPGGGEQEDMADLCERAGVALRLPIDADAPAIARAVERLLADGYLTLNAERLRSAFARVDGPATAATALETLAGGVRPERRPAAPAMTAAAEIAPARTRAAGR